MALDIGPGQNGVGGHGKDTHFASIGGRRESGWYR